MPRDAVLVPLTLVVGDEELLVSRAVSAVVQAAREQDPGVEVRDLRADELGAGELPELLSPSLFGDRRVVVVRAAQDLDKATAAQLVAYAQDPVDGICLVVCHAGGAKGKALLPELGKAGRTVKAAKPKPAERRDFLRQEFEDAGRPVTPAALALLLEAVGPELRELASAASQLLADEPGRVDEEVVARYHRGRADLKGFAIADRVVVGDLPGALELARWGQATGLAPVLVTSAVAASLRGIAQVAGERHTPAGQLAGRLGVPPWKVDVLRRQAQGWGPQGLSTALRDVAHADADVKGEAADKAYAVERLLRQVVLARRSGR